MNIAAQDLHLKRHKTATPNIVLKLAIPEEAGRVADFLRIFFMQSDWANDLQFDWTKALHYLQSGIRSGATPYVLARDEKHRIVGVCSYHTFDVFEKPVAVMDETYVVPEYRKTDLGRRLIGLILELAKAEGCAVMNLPICSGMKEQRSLMNMVEKHFNAVPVGTIYRKVL